MFIEEKSATSRNVVIRHKLNDEELQFWIAVATQSLRYGDSYVIAMGEADKATLELIKRR